MKVIRATVRYLFDQTKWWVAAAVIGALLFPLADLDRALHNPFVPRSNIPFAMFVSLVMALCITFPVLLYIFRVTGRIHDLLGAGRTIALSAIAWVITVYLTGESADEPKFLTPAVLVDVVTYALVLSTALFLFKGKAPYFSPRTVAIDSKTEDAI